MKAIDDLRRNDLKGALEIAGGMIAKGTYTSQHAEILLMLQDDPKKLIEALDQLLKEYGYGSRENR